jgi:hypothetical protein
VEGTDSLDNREFQVIIEDDWVVERVGVAIGRFAKGLDSALVLGDRDGGWSETLGGTFNDVGTDVGPRANLVKIDGDISVIQSAVQRSELSDAVFVVNCRYDPNRVSRLFRERGRAVERIGGPGGQTWIIAFPSSRLSVSYESVDGWLSPEEAGWLTEAGLNSRLAIEFGAWCGRSTLCLSSAEQLVSVDTWLGSPLDPSQDKIASGLRPVDRWRSLTESLPNVVGLIADLRSQTAMEVLTSAYGGRCDLVFIDANHGYANVSRDIRLARSLLQPGGILCGHDYSENHPGVVRAVDELVPGHSISAGSVWFARSVH